MATSVEINGVNFLSIKEASKLVSYSGSYPFQFSCGGEVSKKNILHEVTPTDISR